MLAVRKTPVPRPAAAHPLQVTQPVHPVLAPLAPVHPRQVLPLEANAWRSTATGTALFTLFAFLRTQAGAGSKTVAASVPTLVRISLVMEVWLLETALLPVAQAHQVRPAAPVHQQAPALRVRPAAVDLNWSFGMISTH